MSKEIIIKSPIKILTERSNCTQLNDGEIGIYQPPYRYKNEDGTLGDFKCKKVQIYTKINGEIRKTNTYKPTGIIHHKPIPFDARVGEIYKTDRVRLEISYSVAPDDVEVKLPFFSNSLFARLFPNGIHADFPSDSAPLGKRLISCIPNGSPSYAHNLDVRAAYESKFISINTKFNSIQAGLYIYLYLDPGIYSFRNVGGHRQLCELEDKDVIGMPHSMHNVKKYVFIKKRKLHKNNLGFWGSCDAQLPNKRYRYCPERNIYKHGKICEVYCTKRYNRRTSKMRLKRVTGFPINYYLKKLNESANIRNFPVM